MRDFRDIPEEPYDPEDDWPDPDWTLLDKPVSLAPEAPIELLGSAEDWTIQHADSASAPVDYVMGGLLAAMAGLIGNTRVVEAWPGFRAPCALWFMLIGAPSSGKTPALQPITRALSNIEAELLEEFKPELDAWEAHSVVVNNRLEKWKEACKKAEKNGQPYPPKPASAEVGDRPIPPCVKVQDATIEKIARLEAKNPRGLIVYRDELSGFFGNIGRYGSGGANMAERGFYNEAFNGQQYEVARVSEEKNIRINRHLLSVVGGIQPDLVDRCLFGSGDDGLASRFILVAPKARPFMPSMKAADDTALQRAFDRLRRLKFAANASKPDEPIVVPLNDAAKLLYRDWTIEDHQKATEASGGLSAYFGKFRGIALRLALVFEYSDWAWGTEREPPDSISEAAVQRAIDFIEDYVRPMTKHVYYGGQNSVLDDRARSLLKEVQERGVRQFRLREVYREWRVSGLGGENKVEKSKEAAALLEREGWLRQLPSGRGASLDYAVNPALFAERAPEHCSAPF